MDVALELSYLLPGDPPLMGELPQTTYLLMICDYKAASQRLKKLHMCHQLKVRAAAEADPPRSQQSRRSAVHQLAGKGDPIGMGMALPDDALAEILRRLPPRSLATSRCVCKAWQAIVDGRRLLLPELLPHSVRGIFLMHNELRYPTFLAHPSMEPEIFDNLNFNRHADVADAYWGSSATVLGHCNGLLLYEDMEGLHVVNPATQRHERLPPPPPPPFGMLSWGSDHLVFDPTESLHYEVFFVPRAPESDAPSLEWPASTWVLCVFSSRTGQWEERAFVCEDEAAGMAEFPENKQEAHVES
ncbi:hypothetical protein U9M48_036679 [Paspalum notatum var. saurae]|uniref:F-box domain-containing protein n=1 Tax=Paspalum notatum var. saurae TaxID=547442 RepID=A0AAQ3XBE2_PASNO